MKHRTALLVALAVGSLVAFLMVGRVRASEPAGIGSPPTVASSWQYQLEGPIDVTVEADIFDLDAFSTRRSVVDDLHARGRMVLCYLDAGSWEPYRPDAGRFPAAVLGRAVEGWPGERWLDVRRMDVLRPIMRDRLERCAAKGFDGVEFDWIDGYAQDTGFAITRADQLRYDRWLAQAAHARGLVAALKNGGPLVPSLVDGWDLAVTESCFAYHECWRYAPFLEAGKPVLDAEYASPPEAWCDRAGALGIAAIGKHLDLDAWRMTC